MDSIKDIVPYLSNNLYGLKNEDGDILVEPYFTKIEIVNDLGHPMMKATFPNGGVGYLEQLTTNNKIEIHIPINHPNQYRKCYLTKKGLVVSSIRNIQDKYWVFCSVEDEKCGIMDSNQNIIIDPIFDWFASTNHYAIWLDKKIDGRESGTIKKLDFIFLISVEEFFAHKLEIFDDYTQFPDVYLTYDSLTKVVIIPNFDDSHNLVSGNVWYLEGGYYGLMSADGRIIIEPTFDVVHVRANGLADVKVKGLYAVLDNEGNQIIEFTNYEITNQGDGEYWLWKNESEYIKRKVKNKSYWSK